MSSDFSFNPPPWTGEPALIAELWQLRKHGRKAVCTLWNHPEPGNAELRLDVEGRDSTFLHSANLEALLDVAQELHAGLIAKVGWSDPA